jgi:hypothetical protein
LAEVLRAAMALDDPARAGAVLPSLVNAAQRALPDSRLRDLLGITRFAARCQQPAVPEEGPHRAAWLIGRAGALNDFQGALSIDPGNDRALANLDAVCAVLGRTAEYPELFAKTSLLPDSLRDVYERALIRLPQTRAELDARISEIHSLRQAQ